MKSVAVLLTVFNRREKTLKCLQSLYSSKLPNDYSLDTFLVDDGSTDGTESAVQINFPNVKLIHGDGSLYWNRGMYVAWNEASKGNYDYYLWLNDDTFVYPNSLAEVLKMSEEKSNKTIMVGSTCSSLNKELTTYGGRGEKGLIVPNGLSQECQTFNGNFVLIPRFVYKELGNLDYYFRHSFGDIEYGMRARKKGIKIYLAPTHVGTCESHDQVIKCFSTEIPISDRIKYFYSPLGMNPFEFLHMNIKYKSFIKSCSIFLTTHLRVFFPRLWL